MAGMNLTTGRSIDGIDHLCQSIGKILTTPISTRTQRRPFGSELPDLIDAPNNAATRVRLYAAAAAALMQWEPRLQLTRVRLGESEASGEMVIDIEGITTISGDFVSTSVQLTNGSAA
jgi:uncharacterized protein